MVKGALTCSLHRAAVRQAAAVGNLVDPVQHGVELGVGDVESPFVGEVVGILRGGANSFEGPSIRFEPGIPPTYNPGVE